MEPHLLTSFEIQNELKFNGVYSINTSPKNKGWGICNKS